LVKPHTEKYWLQAWWKLDGKRRCIVEIQNILDKNGNLNEASLERLHSKCGLGMAC